MSETAAQIRKHIDVLSEFEQKYGEYLVAHHNRQMEGQSDWSSRQWAERERELRMLAPRAEAAIEASGVEGYAEMPSLILAFKDWVGFSAHARDDDLQREILRLIPSQLAGLHMRLEEAEAAPSRRGRPVKGMLSAVKNRLAWLNNPWIVGIGVTVIGGAILALFS